MGTSHRHKAGPIGSPNWGKSSAAVSSIANTEKADVQLQQDPSIAIPQEAVDRKRVVYAKRINTQYHNAVRYLVRAAGGRASVSSGRSRAVGRAGVVWATGLAHAFHEIAEQGLVTWLNRKGYNFGVPHDCRETLNIIEGFVVDILPGSAIHGPHGPKALSLKTAVYDVTDSADPADFQRFPLNLCGKILKGDLCRHRPRNRGDSFCIIGAEAISTVLQLLPAADTVNIDLLLIQTGIGILRRRSGSRHATDGLPFSACFLPQNAVLSSLFRLPLKNRLIR